MSKKAKAKLKEFMNAYQERDYKKMFEYSQITWKESIGSEEKIREVFSHFEIDDYKITDITVVEKHIAMDFNVAVLIRGNWSHGRVRLVCEQAAYKPSKNGFWGVNPVSAINILHEAVLP